MKFLLVLVICNEIFLLLLIFTALSYADNNINDINAIARADYWGKENIVD
jgi:hypothetical protein